MTPTCRDEQTAARRAVLNHLATCMTAPSTTEIAERADHPSRTTRRALEDLVAHGVVVRLAGGEGDRWELTARTREWLEATSPVSSGGVDTQSESGRERVGASASTNVPIHTFDDITGNVGSAEGDPGDCPFCGRDSCEDVAAYLRERHQAFRDLEDVFGPFDRVPVERVQ